MPRLLLACAVILFPLMADACAERRAQCMKQVETLVAYRTQAIQAAFGDLFGDLPATIKIHFVGRRDPQYARFADKGGYDQGRRTLILPLRVLGAKKPNPLQSALAYWPFYESKQVREEFPVIETLDNALLNVSMQEAAARRGLTWPHENCSSSDAGLRLPCEMLVEGIAEQLRRSHRAIFNANRLELIWPENFAEFRRDLWREGDEKYGNVKRYGGILLISPLIKEFGVPRALEYIAQTPFRIEENNMRISALRYQERARRDLM